MHFLYKKTQTETN